MAPSRSSSSSVGGPSRQPKRRNHQLATSPPPRFPFLLPPPTRFYSRHSRRNNNTGEGPSKPSESREHPASNSDIDAIVISDDDTLLPVMPPQPRQLNDKHPDGFFEPPQLYDGRLPISITPARRKPPSGQRPIPYSKPDETVPTFLVLPQQNPQRGVDPTRPPPVPAPPPFHAGVPADAGGAEHLVQAWYDEVLELYRGRMDEWLKQVSILFKVCFFEGSWSVIHWQTIEPLAHTTRTLITKAHALERKHERISRAFTAASTCSICISPSPRRPLRCVPR